MTERDSGGRRRSGDQKNWTGNTFSGDSRNHNGDVNGNVIHNNYYGPEQRDSSPVLEQRNKDIILAASAGATKRVKWLLSKGYHVDYRDSHQLTALHHAALSGKKDTVDVLRDAGFNPNVSSENWGTPLHLAVLKSHTAAVKALRKEGTHLLHPSLLRPCGIMGTLLHCAYFAGNDRMIDMLNLSGANKLESTEASVCVSWMQSLQGCSTFSAMLESLGIEERPEEIVDVLSCSPIYMAVIANKSRLIHKISAPLFDSTRLSTTFSVRISELLTASAVSDLWHCTHVTDILTFVIRSTDRSALSPLLQAGVNCNARCTPLEVTPLMTAASMGLTDVVKILLDRGAYPDLLDEQGHNAQWYVTTHVQNPKTRGQLIEMLHVRENVDWEEESTTPSETSSDDVPRSPDQGVCLTKRQSSIHDTSHLKRRNSFTSSNLQADVGGPIRDKNEGFNKSGKGYESDQGCEKASKARGKGVMAFERDYVTIDLASSSDAPLHRSTESSRSSGDPVAHRLRSAPPSDNAHRKVTMHPNRAQSSFAPQSTSAVDVPVSAQQAAMSAKTVQQQQRQYQQQMAAYAPPSHPQRLRRSPSDIDYDPSLDGPFPSPFRKQQNGFKSPYEIPNPYNQAPPPSFNPPSSSQRRTRRLETRTGDLWINEKLVKTPQGDKWVQER